MPFFQKNPLQDLKICPTRLPEDTEEEVGNELPCNADEVEIEDGAEDEHCHIGGAHVFVCEEPVHL